MRKVILNISVTLDGFTAGANDELDWVVVDPDEWKFLVAEFRKTDTVLLGRLNYVGFQGYWPHVADFPSSTPTDIEFSRWLDATPKVVFSKTLKQADWKNSRLAQDDTVAEISQLKQQPGKDILLMNSTRLAHSLMEHDLIDEFWLTVSPVAIGKGRPLFKDLQEKMRLKLLDAQGFGMGSILSRYERVRE
jgi:dihydrofolate reductase